MRASPYATSRRWRIRRLLLTAALVLCAAGSADAAPPSGLEVVRVLGSRAPDVLAPKSGRLTALVEIPSGKKASDLGVVEVAPGIGRLSGDSGALLAFGAAHPDVHVEVPPPLHTLLARAQMIVRADTARFQRNADGTGAAVGIVDTGIDPTLADFRDPTTGKSRIAWILDLSMKPLGRHADLETKFDVTDAQGNPLGAVLTGADIDDLIAKNQPIPQDPNGHGTHVASIAAGNGGGTPYIGMAPKAALVIARVTRDASGSIDNGDTLQGAAFVFDRAAALGMPLAANFSLGTDFGPHDGNTLWEKTLASFAGPNQPGHAIVAAMGNSGSIIDTPIHQAVEVTRDRVRVPVTASGDVTNGSVQIWVALRAGADVKVGLEGPDGTWVSPISDGDSSAHNTSDYKSGVIFGSKAPNTIVPDGSQGAIVVWTGKWPKGVYAVTIEGHGYADLYLEGLGDASLEGPTPAYFSDETGATRSVREATVNLPATSPGIISVGCSIDNPSWTSLGGQKIGITEPVLDDYGGFETQTQRQEVGDGEVCYFSSAGPTLTGVPKPDILAPGAVVIGAMSQAALPGSPNSIFTTNCPPDKKTGQVDPKCMEIDPTHAVALGTSMSSPMVTGVTALLFQADPTLTEDEVRALLQAGAHRTRGPAPFWDQSGPGELDAIGALDALGEMSQPDAALPDAGASWMTLSEDFLVADGSTPLTATLEMRTATGKRASLFDDSRLRPFAMLDGTDLAPPIVRGEAPGLFTFVVRMPAWAHANDSITLGATFDGQTVVGPLTIPVALDPWTAGYPSFSEGGCNASRGGTGELAAPLFLLGLLALRRRAR